MSISIGTSYAAIASAIAAMTDIKERKVRNVHLIIVMIAGCIHYHFLDMFGDLSAIGFSIPFIVHYLPFKLRLVSAGDIKLFMVVGLFTGMDFVINCMIATYLIGGFVAFLILIYKRELVAGISRIVTYVVGLVTLADIKPYNSGKTKEESLPFAAFVFLGVLVTQILVW